MWDKCQEETGTCGETLKLQKSTWKKRPIQATPTHLRPNVLLNAIRAVQVEPLFPSCNVINWGSVSGNPLHTIKIPKLTTKINENNPNKHLLQLSITFTNIK